METFDLIVIGGGSAGFSAARMARERFERVAIVDGSEELGGLCILRGCMPSKTVIYSAEVLHHARNGKMFGLEIPEAWPDMKKVKDRKVRMVNEFKEYRQEQLQSEKFHLYRDFAEFEDAETIRLQGSGERLRGRHFMISTGSRPGVPNIPGLNETPYLTSDDILDLDFLPGSVVALGGGVVACELVQYLARMGSHVIQIQRSPRILKEMSDIASQVLMTAFRKEGIELHTGTMLEKIEQTPNGDIRVHYQHLGESRVAEGAYLFNALGRVPALDGLNLEAAGVGINAAGKVVVNEFQQTSQPHIYAGGDVTGPYEIVHIAIMQGEVAAGHMLGKQPEPVNYATRTGVVFTDPQIAAVGLTEEEAAEEGYDVVSADFPFDDHGKSILMEAKAGYVKAWADRKTRKLLGAECVGKDAGELIHSMAVAVSLNSTVEDLLKVHWYHPTLSEIWTYPLEDIAEV